MGWERKEAQRGLESLWQGLGNWRYEWMGWERNGLREAQRGCGKGWEIRGMNGWVGKEKRLREAVARVGLTKTQVDQIFNDKERYNYS